MKQCEGIYAHSIDSLITVALSTDSIIKKCEKCGFEETLPRSSNRTYFINNLAVQKKKWAADDNRKETLQPMKADGSVNDEFTEAYGYNPFDERTKAAVPNVQKGT